MKVKAIIAGIAGVLLLILVVLFSPFTEIGAGHRGVITVFGAVQDTVLGEGFHFISPTASIHSIDVRTQKVQTDADAASSDLQSVNATVAVNYHVNPIEVAKLYQEVSGDVQETVIDPAIQEAVKAATAGFTAEELITKRPEVSGLIQKNLVDRLSTKHLIVETVSIVNFSFSDSFNAAIEAKVTAEQNALAAKNKLDQIQYEAQQTVATATAAAESIRIQAEALKSNPDLVNLKAVEKWNGVLPSYVMGNAVPFIDINK